jgi:hypothetical protein
MDDNWMAVAKHVGGGVSIEDCRDRYYRIPRKTRKIVSSAAH